MNRLNRLVELFGKSVDDRPLMGGCFSIKYPFDIYTPLRQITPTPTLSIRGFITDDVPGSFPSVMRGCFSVKYLLDIYSALGLITPHSRPSCRRSPPAFPPPRQQ
jgi:hypothetical protein